MWGVEVWLDPLIVLECREINDQLYALPFSLLENTPVPLELETGWPPDPVWTFWRREKFRLCQNSNQRVVHILWASFTTSRSDLGAR